MKRIDAKRMAAIEAGVLDEYLNSATNRANRELDLRVFHARYQLGAQDGKYMGWRQVCQEIGTSRQALSLRVRRVMRFIDKWISAKEARERAEQIRKERIQRIDPEKRVREMALALLNKRQEERRVHDVEVFRPLAEALANALAAVLMILVLLDDGDVAPPFIAGARDVLARAREAGLLQSEEGK